ncbi:MAG: CHAD domain-containing protein [Actinomycetota bacterium]|nr:CHAD domain-containing protein [Actinomycetota bacterium]
MPAKKKTADRAVKVLREAAQDGDVQRAAAAALATGAAATAGKIGRDRVVAKREREARAFALHEGEPVPDGVRRIARGQIDEALDRLEGRAGEDLGTSVHGARKGLKRLRATVRLARDELGVEAYRRENIAFREVGRRLAGARDAQVMVETLDALCKRHPDEVPAVAAGRLRLILAAEHEQAQQRLATDEHAVAEAGEELQGARARVATWSFQRSGFNAVAPGVRRTYRRGRRAYRAARADPTTEHLHDWRKRVKDLWHATQILEPAHPERMAKLATRTHELSDLLGDDHDLAVLDAGCQRRGRDVGDETELAALHSLVNRRRAELQREAMAAGKRVYKAKPKAFVRDIERRWRKRAAAS